MDYTNYVTARPMFDSDEELYFVWWLEELKQLGYILSWRRSKAYSLCDKVKRGVDIVLKTKTKQGEQHVMNGAYYTPDFDIEWTPKALGVFVSYFGNRVKSDVMFYCGLTLRSVVEIKGMHDRNREIPLYTLKIKWLFQKYGIYVHLLKMPKIFKDTFTPARYLTTNKSGIPRSLRLNKKPWTPKPLSEFVDSTTPTKKKDLFTTK